MPGRRPKRLAGDYGLFILSDFPAANFSEDAQQAVLDRVAKGAGLLMVGGWESFHGAGGDWDGTPIGNVLPVEIAGQDDRRNCDVPVLVAGSRNIPLHRICLGKIGPRSSAASTRSRPSPRPRCSWKPACSMRSCGTRTYSHFRSPNNCRCWSSASINKAEPHRS